MSISVTKDGYVDLGHNEWASLEQIQEAVLKATNPGLTVNCPEGKPPRDHRTGLQVVNLNRNGGASNEQQHLPMPSSAPLQMSEETEDEIASLLRNVSNCGEEEHLPLPSTVVRRTLVTGGQPPLQILSEQHMVMPTMSQRKN